MDLNPIMLYRARTRIDGYIRRTPLICSDALSELSCRNVYLKLENQQITGAFKIRGAANKLLGLSDVERARGVVTVSTGNHGRAMAHVGATLGTRVVVCVPEQVLPHKVAAMRALGADVQIEGANQDEAEEVALRFVEEQGLTPVSPFDDPEIIAGQGTIGIELLEDLPQVDTVVVPLSGGGLMGGIAVAVKAASPAIRMVGVSMDRGPAMVESLRAGRPVPVIEEPTLADSLVGGIGLDNRYSFELIRRTVDETVLVSEEEIAAAMRMAFLDERQIIEGGAAVGIAALMHEKVAELGNTVAVVVSGGNVDMAKLLTIVQR